MKQLNTLTLSALLLLGSFCPCPEASAQSALDNFITDHMATEHISGLSAVLVRDNAIVWYGNYGLADRDANIPVTDSTIFMLASASKTITATALMQLVEDGAIGLDDPVNNHIPFTVVNPNHPDSVITVKQLLTHTSSIADNWDVMPYTVGDPTTPLSDYLFDYLDASGAIYDPALNFNAFAPNSTYQYSNIGIALVGYIVETVSGMPFNTYCNLNIFAPLCMDNTGWFLSELDTTLVAHPYTWTGGIYTDEGLYGYADYPDGQLRTTALSLAKFMYAHMNYGNFDGTQLLDSSTVAYMRSEVVPAIEPSQGIVFYTFDDAYGTWWGHNGGDLGVSTNMYFDEATNTGLITLTNGDGDHGPIRNAILDALDSLENEHVADIACNIVLPTSTPEVSRAEPFTLFPNPATDQITLSLATTGHVRIMDMTGKVVSSQAYAQRMDVRQLDPGTYTVVVQTPVGERVSVLVKL
ncbi:MAG: serine hydrolase [Flavobacteriales bacterium]|nr:serine hydrolase [Flavobacteriales bacterium]